MLLRGPRPARLLYPPHHHRLSTFPISSFPSVANNTASAVLRSIQARHVSTKKTKNPKQARKSKQAKKSKKQKEIDPFLAQFQEVVDSSKPPKSASFGLSAKDDTPPKVPSPAPRRSARVSTPKSKRKSHKAVDSSRVPKPSSSFDLFSEDNTPPQVPPEPQRSTDVAQLESTRTAEGETSSGDAELHQTSVAPESTSTPVQEVRDTNAPILAEQVGDHNAHILVETAGDHDGPMLGESAGGHDTLLLDEQGSDPSPDSAPIEAPEAAETTKKYPDKTKKMTKAGVRRQLAEKTDSRDNRVWTKTGRHLSTTAEIGVATLGKPATALIVKARDGNTPVPKKKTTKRGRKAKNGQKAAAAEEEQEEDIDNVVIHEEGLQSATEERQSTVDTMMAQSQAYVTDEDIFKNINQLRPPKGHTVLSQTDYDDLFNLLHRGFTRSQTEQYIHYFPNEAQDPSKTPPWIVSFPQYAPDTKNLAKDVEQSRRSPNALTKKDALVIHILTDLWNLTLPGSQEGYLDIRLRDAEFGLLLAGTQRALRFMARFYLAEGGRIEAFPEAKTIRVVAPRNTAYRILDEMNSLLADTDCKHIALREMPKTSTFDKMVKELGRLTNTYIWHDLKKKELLVHWINLSDRPKHLENLRDTVYRFLLSSFYKWPGSTSRLALWPGAGDQTKGHHFLEPEHERQRWVWHRRLGRWVRWVREISVDQTPEEVDMDSKRQVLQVPDNILVDGWRAEPSAELETFTSSGWSTALHSTTRATFGHVLVPKTTEALEPPTPMYEPQPNPRMLSPVTPPIQALIGVDRAMGLDDVTLLLKFIPRQSRRAKGPQPSDAPPLEVMLDVVGDEVRNPTCLRAILADRASDILFPAAVVDARIFQDRFAKFDPRALASHRELQKFLSLCQFNMERGNLATPSAVHLPIPRRLFVDRKASPASERIPLDETNLRVDHSFADELIDVEYIFAGMELRRTVKSFWVPGLVLTYTSIEGGKGGGHRAELGLAIDPEEQSWDFDKDGPPTGVEQEFLRQVHEIANGKAFSWLATPELTTNRSNKSRAR